MKKWFKTLLIVIAVLLVLITAATIFIHFSSPKYKLQNGTIERVYIYHNELGRELYEFTFDEKSELSSILINAHIGSTAFDEYEKISGGPWFSFFCEMKSGNTVQVYTAGDYIFINSVPFEIDATSRDKLSELHYDIEDKILPISPELIEEILNKRENA